AHDLAGHAEDERAVGDRLAFGDERSRAHEAIATDGHAIEDDRADADQRILADRAAVEHHEVAHAHVAREGHRHAAVGMDHRAVLDVHILAERDDVVVAADRHAPPHARAVLHHDRADDGGVGSDVVVALEDGPAKVQLVDHEVRPPRPDLDYFRIRPA